MMSCQTYSSAYNTVAQTGPMSFVHNPYGSEHEMSPPQSGSEEATSNYLGSSVGDDSQHGSPVCSTGKRQHNMYNYQQQQQQQQQHQQYYNNLYNTQQHNTVTPPQCHIVPQQAPIYGSSSIPDYYGQRQMCTPVAPEPSHPAYVPCRPDVHTYLSGQVEYLAIPEHACLPLTSQWHRQFKLFIGHIKFEMSPDGLRWLIYMLTGVQCGKIEVRGMGCFMVFFSTEEDVFQVRGLHKRVMFDHNGVWFVKNEAQEAILMHYADRYAPSVHAKLPKGLMVVDVEVSRRRGRKTNGKSQTDVSTPTSVSTPATTGSHNSGFQTHATGTADQLWNCSH